MDGLLETLCTYLNEKDSVNVDARLSAFADQLFLFHLALLRARIYPLTDIYVHTHMYVYIYHVQRRSVQIFLR